MRGEPLNSRLTSIAVALFLALPAGGASAQGVGRNAGVAERARPDFDPLGIRASSFLVYPSLSVLGTFNDNVFATDADTSSDFVTTVQPEVQVSSDWSRHALNGRAYARFNRYLDNETLNATTWGFSAAGDLDLASRGAATGNLLFQREVQPRTDPENPGGTEPSLFDRSKAALSYGRNFNRLITRTDADVERISFVDATNQALDRTETRLAGRLGYQISPRLAGFVQPGYLWRRYDQAGPSGEDRGSREWSVLAGVAIEIRSLLVADIGVGYFRADFEAPGVEPTSGLALSGTATWYPTERLTASAGASRSTQATRQEGLSSRVGTSVQVRADYELYRNVIVGAQFQYGIDEFEGLDRRDNVYGASARARWLVNRNASVFLEAASLTRTSDAPGEGYTQNTITLGIRFQM